MGFRVAAQFGDSGIGALCGGISRWKRNLRLRVAARFGDSGTRLNDQYGEHANERDGLLKQKVDLSSEVEELSEAIFNQHTAIFSKLNDNYGVLANERDGLLKQKVDLTCEVEELSEAIFNQHTAIFNKVIA
ncbi:uncharacterized protein HKW66_Vig0126210 [Vigna angularis]|uniref:Uncharacterized protein n=1 Tax=Phaseolus angularis TaxID=3914 RepID=A0A8T0K3S7_PHAAN|nr:uncharacterized protein HKW66_Vig0126210 [Vigna angularis]